MTMTSFLLYKTDAGTQTLEATNNASILIKLATKGNHKANIKHLRNYTLFSLSSYSDCYDVRCAIFRDNKMSTATRRSMFSFKFYTETQHQRSYNQKPFSI